MYLLEVQDLQKKKEKQTSVDSIRFKISEKGVYGFLGKKQSGKTLLAELLAGVCEADGGSISYNGKMLFANEKQTAEIKKKIGYVASVCFFDRDITVFESLDLLGKAKMIEPDKRFRQIKEALELTGLSLRRDTLVGDLIPSDRKRLMIASSLLGNPDVIIMDDPLRTFERKQTEEIKKLIAMLGRKKVVVMFSSRPEEIEELCDNIALLHNGRVVAEYKKDELLGKIKENGLGDLASVLDALTEEVGEGENNVSGI